MHRDGTLTRRVYVVLGFGGVPMGRKVFGWATALGSVLQIILVLLGLVFPAIQRGNLYPIVGTLLAVFAGFLFAKWSPGLPLPSGLVGGSFAGGVSSFLGVVVAALTGQAAPSPITTILVATLTGLVAGAVGGFFGTLFRSAGHRPERQRYGL